MTRRSSGAPRAPSGVDDRNTPYRQGKYFLHTDARQPIRRGRPGGNGGQRILAPGISSAPVLNKTPRLIDLLLRRGEKSSPTGRRGSRRARSALDIRLRPVGTWRPFFVPAAILVLV